MSNILGDPIRLGNKEFIKYGNSTRPRRGPRLIKLVFRDKEAVNEILWKKARLVTNPWFANTYIKKDKTRDERTADFNRRRNSYGESGPQTQANSSATPRTDIRNEAQIRNRENRTGENGDTSVNEEDRNLEATNRATDADNQEEETSRVSQRQTKEDTSTTAETVTETISREGERGQEADANRDQSEIGNETTGDNEENLPASGNQATGGRWEMG